MSRIAVALTACAALASACSPAATHPPRPQAAPPRLWALGTEDYPDVTTIPPTTEPTTTTTEAPVAEPVPVTTPAHTHTTTVTTEYDPPTPQSRSIRESGECWAVPAYIVARESGCRNIPNEQGSGCDGYYAICKATWAGYGGYPDALSAPKAVQDAKASELWSNGAGASHWGA